MIDHSIFTYKQKILSRYRNMILPMKEKVHNQVLSLPCHTCLIEEEYNIITEHCNNFK